MLNSHQQRFEVPDDNLRSYLTFRIRNAPYGVFRFYCKHHMVFFDIATINNKLTIQGVLQHLETLHI